MKHCSCGFLRSIAAFQSGSKTLKICSTCQEWKAQSKTSSRSPVCQHVALASLSESDFNCLQEHIETQKQQAWSKQQYVENNWQCFCSDCQFLLSEFAFQPNNSCCITCEKEYQCCSCCDFSQSVAVFQFSFEILQICSTCQEWKAWANAQSRAWCCVALTSLSESDLNCLWEHVDTQEQQAQPKQWCVENNWQHFCSVAWCLCH